MIELMRELINKTFAGRLTRGFFRHPGCLKSHRVFGAVVLNNDSTKEIIH